MALKSGHGFSLRLLGESPLLIVIGFQEELAHESSERRDGVRVGIHRLESYEMLNATVGLEGVCGDGAGEEAECAIDSAAKAFILTLEAWATT